MKYDSGGHLLWEARYNGPANTVDVPSAIIVDQSGNAYVTGTSGGQYATVKYDFNGNQLWVARYGTAQAAQATGIAVETAGNVYVTGSSGTVKYDSLGNQCWALSPQDGKAVAVDMAGRVYVAGIAAGAGGSAYFTAAYETNGNNLWLLNYDSNGSDEPSALVVDAFGRNVYVTGRSDSGYATLRYNSPITLHRLDATALSVRYSDSPDEPLVPSTDAFLLANQPEIGSTERESFGLVADGVTPLLVKLSFGRTPSQPVSNTITLSVEGGSLVSGDINEKLRVLSDSGWVSTSVLVQDAAVEFLYIAPISADDVFLTPGSTELAVRISIEGGGNLLSKRFAVKKPPIVLAHGYHTDKSTWSARFISALAFSRGSAFVVPVNYGVNGGNPAHYFNTSGRLDELTRALDAVLQQQIESPTSELHKNWAFTRYDVIGHSQGGLLARILCATNRTSLFPGFRNEENFFRGRFHRLVTIGSPHNGTRGVYYAEKVLLTDSLYGAIQETLFVWLLNVLQTKFDPFGAEMNWANSLPIDSRAPFHCIQTTINGGEPPRQGLTSCPLIGRILGLCHEIRPGVSRGSIVFPSGLDGIVDLDSQGGGQGTMVTYLDGDNIAHSGPESAFGVAINFTQTESAEVAQAVSALLDGPVQSFGSFVIPQRLSAEIKADIDEAVPRSVVLDVIQKILAPTMHPNVDTFGGAANSQSNSYSFLLSTSGENLSQDDILWGVEGECPQRS